MAQEIGADSPGAQFEYAHQDYGEFSEADWDWLEEDPPSFPIDLAGNLAREPEPEVEQLAQTVHDLDEFQSTLHYRQAQNALQQLLSKLDLTPQEQQGLETEIAGLQRMLDKLENQVVQIAAFGMVGRGKSSLLNALLGQELFATGPLHGVTQSRQQCRWVVGELEVLGNLQRISLGGVGQSRIELIDTPGIDEIDGADRERLAGQVARQADLILFIISGDMTRVEHAALSELRQASKPILLVFNKIDQYPEADREAIYAKIRDERVRDLLSVDEIVMAAASPLVARAFRREDGSLGAQLVPGPPQVEALKLKILEVLEREGKALVALNTLLYADDVNEQLVQRKMALRDRAASQIIWKAVMTKALSIALNPITVVDILSSLAVDVAMVVALSRLYGIEITYQGAMELLQKIALTLGGISLSELAANLGLSSLKGLLSLSAPVTGGTSLLIPYLSVAITQAGVAGVSTYGIGQVIKQYLVNGAAWGPAGPRTVVQQILASLDQTYILNRIKDELTVKLRAHPTWPAS